MWLLSSHKLNSNDDDELEEQADEVDDVLDRVRGVVSGDVDRGDGPLDVDDDDDELDDDDAPSKIFLIVLSKNACCGVVFLL